MNFFETRPVRIETDSEFCELEFEVVDLVDEALGFVLQSPRCEEHMFFAVEDFEADIEINLDVESEFDSEFDVIDDDIDFDEFYEELIDWAA